MMLDHSITIFGHVYVFALQSSFPETSSAHDLCCFMRTRIGTTEIFHYSDVIMSFSNHLSIVYTLNYYVLPTSKHV